MAEALETTKTKVYGKTYLPAPPLSARLDGASAVTFSFPILFVTGQGQLQLAHSPFPTAHTGVGSTGRKGLGDRS